MMNPGYAGTSKKVDIEKIKVLSHGVQRSGSTWICQILTDLHPPGSVLKTHNYLDLPPSIPVISTYRDFRDCAVSHWRQSHPDLSAAGKPMSLEDTFLFAGMYQHTIWILGQYAKRRNSALIRYEEAFADPGVILRVIKEHLKIDVPPDRWGEILAKHSIEENRRMQSAGEHASVGMQPNHIHEGTPGTWKRFVTDPDLLTELMEAQLRRWGYL